jgi:hypothetical protein
MCGPSVASLAEQQYQQIKPEKLTLPSLSIGKKKDRKTQYAGYRTGQERRQTLLNVGNDYA